MEEEDKEKEEEKDDEEEKEEKVVEEKEAASVHGKLLKKTPNHRHSDSGWRWWGRVGGRVGGDHSSGRGEKKKKESQRERETVGQEEKGQRPGLEVTRL